MSAEYNPFQEIFNRLDKIESLLTKEQQESQRVPETDKWFDLKGLIEYLPSKPKEQTVYDWTHQRKIPFYKNSDTKMLTFLKSEIDNWLKTGRRKTQAEKDAEVKKYLNKNRNEKL